MKNKKIIYEDFDPMTDVPDDDMSYDNDNGMSYTEQCAADRSDYANEMIAAGKIDKEQANEIKYGA